ncbi:MAG: DUF5668 domain-containing protein [Anaerolineales bacterium]|jgi:hypothetical protein
MNERRKNQKYRGSFVWPILLVAAGIIFLLSNLNIIQGDAWDIFALFWPVIIIAMGLDNLFRDRRFASAILLTGLGTMFLLSNFNLLIWNVWDILWRFWPLLIVAVGIDLLFGKRTWWASLLSAIIALALLVAVVWYASLEPIRGQAMSGTEISYELNGDIKSAEINISPALGNLYLDELLSTNELIGGKVRGEDPSRIWQDFSIQNGTAVFNLESRTNVVTFGNSQWRWDLDLTTEIPLEVNIEMGAGDMNLSMEDLMISDLAISQGVGNISLEIPDWEDQEIDISQAVGQVVVIIPKGLDVKIDVEKAISNLSIPSDFKRIGDSYILTTSTAAEPAVSLQIEQAIGNIEILYSSGP